MNNRILGVALALAAVAGCTFAQASAPHVPAGQSPAGTQAPVRRPGRAGNGTIAGTVKDDTGGVIPGAAVALSNEKGIVQSVQSGADGTYTFRGIPAGTYTVSAAYLGLQQQGVTAITLTAGGTAAGN